VDNKRSWKEIMRMEICESAAGDTLAVDTAAQYLVAIRMVDELRPSDDITIVVREISSTPPSAPWHPLAYGRSGHEGREIQLVDIPNLDGGAGWLFEQARDEADFYQWED